MRRRLVAGIVAAVACVTLVFAQGAERPMSPEGSAATEIGGKFKPDADEPEYQGGKWIEITYGRPIKRGRDLWGRGATYGQQLYAGAPLWRAGANVSTRLKSEVLLVINGKTVPAGEYSLFIDLKPASWTLIVSSWRAQPRYDPTNEGALWGAFGYTPDKDIVRAPMKIDALPFSVEQLTWSFVDMTDGGGRLAVMWDKTMASVPFKVGG